MIRWREVGDERVWLQSLSTDTVYRYCLQIHVI